MYIFNNIFIYVLCQSTSEGISPFGCGKKAGNKIFANENKRLKKQTCFKQISGAAKSFSFTSKTQDF